MYLNSLNEGLDRLIKNNLIENENNDNIPQTKKFDINSPDIFLDKDLEYGDPIEYQSLADFIADAFNEWPDDIFDNCEEDIIDECDTEWEYFEEPSGGHGEYITYSTSYEKRITSSDKEIISNMFEVFFNLFIKSGNADWWLFEDYTKEEFYENISLYADDIYAERNDIVNKCYKIFNEVRNKNHQLERFMRRLDEIAAEEEPEPYDPY